VIYLSFSSSFFPLVRFLSVYRFPSFCICLSVPLFMFSSLSVSLFQVLFPSPVRPPFSLRLSLCTPLSSEVCFFPSSNLSFAWKKYVQKNVWYDELVTYFGILKMQISHTPNIFYDSIYLNQKKFIKYTVYFEQHTYAKIIVMCGVIFNQHVYVVKKRCNMLFSLLDIVFITYIPHKVNSVVQLT